MSTDYDPTLVEVVAACIWHETSIDDDKGDAVNGACRRAALAVLDVKAKWDAKAKWEAENAGLNGGILDKPAQAAQIRELGLWCARMGFDIQRVVSLLGTAPLAGYYDGVHSTKKTHDVVSGGGEVDARSRWCVQAVVRVRLKGGAGAR